MYCVVYMAIIPIFVFHLLDLTYKNKTSGQIFYTIAMLYVHLYFLPN